MRIRLKVKFYLALDYLFFRRLNRLKWFLKHYKKKTLAWVRADENNFFPNFLFIFIN